MVRTPRLSSWLAQTVAVNVLTQKAIEVLACHKQKLILESHTLFFQKFNTRQLFSPFGNSSVVSIICICLVSVFSFALIVDSLFWSLPSCSAKQTTAVSEFNCISSEGWKQGREAIMLEHRPNVATQDIQSLGGTPEVLADWWPTLLCVEAAAAGKMFSGAVILEWKLCSHKCVHQDCQCCLSRIYTQTNAGICWDMQCICKPYATNMHIYALF